MCKYGLVNMKTSFVLVWRIQDKKSYFQLHFPVKNGENNSEEKSGFYADLQTFSTYIDILCILIIVFSLDQNNYISHLHMKKMPEFVSYNL